MDDAGQRLPTRGLRGHAGQPPELGSAVLLHGAPGEIPGAAVGSSVGRPRPARVDEAVVAATAITSARNAWLPHRDKLERSGRQNRRALASGCPDDLSIGRRSEGPLSRTSAPGFSPTAHLAGGH